MPFVKAKTGAVEIQPGIIAAMIRRGRIALGGVIVMLIAANAHAADPSCPAVMTMHLNLPATQAALSHDQAISIVTIGSSSTEGAGASAPDRTYPARLGALLHASWPRVQVTVQNKGIGGQTVDAVLARLDADVLTARPTLVIWQVGTNEALRRMDPAHFDDTLGEGLRRLATIGSDIVLMDYQLAPKMPPAETRSVYRMIIASEAMAHSDSLFSRTALMLSWQAADPTATDMISPDGLHHSDRGYACLAASLNSAIVAAAAPQIAAVNVNLK